MSLVNQPSRILISGDDLEWGSGHNFNMTLPEPVERAKTVECSRAVIPNTQYPIPDYQNKFYYSMNGIPSTLTLTNNRNFATVADLVAQLNADAVAQSKPLTFSYNATTSRVSVIIGGEASYQYVVNNNNNYAVLVDSTSDTYAQVVVAPGTYTIEGYEAALNTAITGGINNAFSQTQEPVWSNLTINANVVLNGGYVFIQYICTAKRALDVVSFDFKNDIFGLDNARRQSSAVSYGWTWGDEPIDFAIPGTAAVPPTAVVIPIQAIPFSGANAPAAVLPRSAYQGYGGTQDKNRFGLNSRLGFPYTGLTGTVLTTFTGTFMPNLIRTKVLYLLGNMSVNDSISTDGLRNVLAKIPVNATYGGVIVYQPPELNPCRIVQDNLQNINLALLDDNYQPFTLQIEEPCEIELVFTY